MQFEFLQAFFIKKHGFFSILVKKRVFILNLLSV